MFWVIRDVERAIAQTGDVSLGTAVGEHEIKDELTVILIFPGKRFDAFLDCFEAESCHLVHPSVQRNSPRLLGR